EGGVVFWRLLVIAEPGSRFSLIEDYASSSDEVAGYSNSVVELFVEQEAKVEYVSLQNLARETWHFASHKASVGRDAELDWVAGVEIQANDVRCTHGATVSQVDRDQLFYAMARGLTQADAERLILRGFFQDVLDRIELEPVREALGEALEARIPQG